MKFISVSLIHFTFSDLITLSVCLSLDDVTFYQSLHDLLKPAMEKRKSYYNVKTVDVEKMVPFTNYEKISLSYDFVTTLTCKKCLYFVNIIL